jgi:mannose-6-phosphate isomerase-like protein (cupin superfamily)
MEGAIASIGQSVVNGATGERVVFQELARESAGALLRGDGFLPPGVGPRGRHVHPNQEEWFEVVEGVVRFRVGREVRIAKAGDVVVVPAGTPHTLHNVGEGDVQFAFEFRPALNIETFFENAFAMLSVRGDAIRVPMILEFAEIAAHYRREFALAPVPLQWGLMVAAPFGRLAGFRPRYPVEA